MMNMTLATSIRLSNHNYNVRYFKIMLPIIFNDITPINTYRQIEYYELPMSFDIETTSIISERSEKHAFMYVWMLGINGYVFIGREWSEFIEAMNLLADYLELSLNRRIIIYVHNLSYEFQFMQKRFSWDKVFSLDTRKPVYAITDRGIEFRCSYILSGYSLERLGKNLVTYKVEKLTGNLDYSLIRHSRTSLTDDELAYCVNDVMVVMAYIQECIEHDKGIENIPLTKTGYVRKYCKKCCLGTSKTRNNSYRKMIEGLYLEPDEYRQLKRAFQGGFTHANAFYSGKIVENVASYDFTSSYPTVMVAEKFPMSRGELVHINSMGEFRNNLHKYCCLFDLEIIGLESKLYFENYLSYSRCWGCSNAVVNNGRIVSADRLFTTITEQDFFIIEKFYEWDEIKIANFRRYMRAYLPTEFIKAILKLYQDKTLLKGVTGYEIEYLKSKEMLNSCYGMIVTDICRDEIIYDNGWNTEPVDVKSAITKYNNSHSRFLYYPWGVWVTAYARKNLFTGIYECGSDYIYSDTDSIKIVNRDKHIKYIEGYNKNILRKLHNAMAWHELPPASVQAKTNEGVIKPLGIWDYEGTYARFKTLGAKRYITESNGKYSLTVAGLSKSVALDYMVDTFKDPFEGFNDELYIPPNHTGKNIHTYIDEIQKGIIRDYRGVESSYLEFSSVHLSPADYSLSIAYEYAQYLLGIRTRSV